jgi:hypothetical protein
MGPPGQPAKRRRVSPMRVVNGDHERPDSTAKEMSVTEPSPSCPQSGGHAAAAGPANSVSRSLASASETRVSKELAHHAERET